MSPSTRIVLRGLRLRLTTLFALVAALGLALFVAVLVSADGRFETDRLDAQLTGQASRAAALVYVDAAGQPQVDAIRDDSITETAAALIVFRTEKEASTTVLFSSGSVSPGALRGLAQVATRDAAERGSLGRVPFEGGEGQAAAMPWFDGEQVAGAAVVVAPAAGPRAGLVVPAVAGGVLLLMLLTGAGWVLAGRSLRPAEESLAGRERFLSTAAHELRGPLTGMRTGAESAARAASRGEPVQPSLARLVSLADSTGQVVTNLLLATRIDHAEVPVRREPVRLDQVAAELEYRYPGLVVDINEPVEVRGDEPLLRHLMTNLIDNAHHHARAERGDVGGPAVTLTVQSRQHGVVVRVADDGPGFPADLDVWVEYVSGAEGGTGLGLALVLWIAGQHDASVAVTNRDEGGAVVEVTFPLVTSVTPV